MARQFTGSEYGALTDNMLDPANPYTMLAWIKKSALETSDQFIFGGRRASSFERNHGILYRGSSGTTLNLYQNGGSAQYLAGAVPSLDVWVPVIITRIGGGTGSQTTSINVDGAMVAGANTQTTLAETPVIGVGASQTSGVIDKYFVGLIGAVAKWNAVLSAPDIASLVAGADPATIDSGNLFESWVFDSDTGSTSTGTNAKVLTWTGSPAYVADSPFATGPTVNSITDPIIGTDAVTIVLSEAAPTVDTINFTVDTVTQSQSYSTGDDTTFTIAAVTRNLLPPIGTVTVELKAGATVIATTTATLQQAAGYSAVTGVGVDDGLAAPHTGVLADGDIALVSDDPNTSLDAAFLNFSQTVAGPFTVDVWDASEELWGVSSFFTVDGGEGSIIGNIITSGIIGEIIS